MTQTWVKLMKIAAVAQQTAQKNLNSEFSKSKGKAVKIIDVNLHAVYCVIQLGNICQNKQKTFLKVNLKCVIVIQTIWQEID